MLHTEKLYCSLLFHTGSEISPEDQAQVATFAEALDAGDSQARAYSRKVWQMNAEKNAGFLHCFADGTHMCS